MMICLIGNSGVKRNLKDGQTTKFRLYKKKIEDEGFDVFLVDLECFFKNPLSVFLKIKKGIKLSDRIVLISGHRACRLLIPYINFINKKNHKPFILPVVGSGVLHYSIDHLNDNDIYNFFVNKDFSLAKKTKRIKEMLSKIDYILLETNLSKDIYQSFYDLVNCRVLDNFRDFDSIVTANNNKSLIKMVYMSRIMTIKGIFDLLECLSRIDDDYVLDIYGTKYLSESEEVMFESFLSNKIKYKGEINNNDVVSVLGKYDLFVFPTRCAYEGTPGVISESLLSGTPILTSNFPQAATLLENGTNSFFYEMYNNVDLYNKLKWSISHKDYIRSMRKAVFKSSEKYTYRYSRKAFLIYICGIE